MNVRIKLDFESDEPIYTQLTQQIITSIAKRELLPGEKLPSVRALAADIGINLHTVNKAYQQLRQGGLILIHRQRGVVVNPDGTPQADQTYKEELLKKLHPLIAESICRGMTEKEFQQLCSQIFSEFNVQEGGK